MGKAPLFFLMIDGVEYGLGPGPYWLNYSCFHPVYTHTYICTIVWR